ncbi:MAG: aldo/keto reductase [bacterium]
MHENFLHTTLGRTGIPVFRLGLSASYWPGKKTVFRAVDEGVNLFFGFGVDFQLTGALRDVFKSAREGKVLVTGAYNYIFGHSDMRRTLERRLRQFGTETIDVFLFMGVMNEKELPDHVVESMIRFREEGKVKAIGISSHDRKLIGKLAQQEVLDVFMLRYNAAHRGAEHEIFPKLLTHDPGVISYTATRWRYLMRRPKGWPKERAIPTPGMAYRFVLTNPAIDVCLTAPRSEREFLENLNAVREGPLDANELRFIYEFGDAVHREKHWFM